MLPLLGLVVEPLLGAVVEPLLGLVVEPLLGAGVEPLLGLVVEPLVGLVVPDEEVGAGVVPSGVVVAVAAGDELPLSEPTRGRALLLSQAASILNRATAKAGRAMEPI